MTHYITMVTIVTMDHDNHCDHGQSHKIVTFLEDQKDAIWGCFFQIITLGAISGPLCVENVHKSHAFKLNDQQRPSTR